MEYKHFSHQHNLNIYQVQPGQQFECSGCESPCYDSVYACWACNFFLHEHCGNANRYVRHPFHPPHPLILVPRPTYAAGSFLCNACGSTGAAFSYCCALCEVDLHVRCAFLPPKVIHKHHPHELTLICTSTNVPNKDEPPHVCKLCTQLLDSRRQWTYVCAKCDFSVHSFCATKEVKPGLYQTINDDSEYPVPQEPHVPAAHLQPTNEGAEPTEDPVVELYKLQLQMQMADSLAQMMSSFNLSSLV